MRTSELGGRLRGARRLLLCLLCLCAAALPSAPRAETYQEPEDYIREAFGGEAPEASVVWLTDEVRAAASDILGHSPGAVRIRYWSRDGRTAWILEEIGKYEPITTGIVIDGGAVADVKVLVYREPRGGEVRYPFFNDQFTGARLSDAESFDRSVDNIAGATLSVRSMRRMVHLALYLDSRTADGG